MPGWFDHWPKTKLLLGGLLFRSLIALLFRQPGYADAFYYSNVAEALWRGRGFREDYIWNYLGRPLPDHLLNNPSSLYWMPLTSILIWLAYSLGGSSFFVSQLPNILLSASLAPLAYYLCQDFFGPGDPRLRRYGWLCGGLAIFCGIYAAWFTFPDNFAPFALLSCLFLVASYKALRLPADQQGKIRRWMALAGVCAGLAYLTRPDGLLLLAAPPLATLLYRRWLRQSSGLGWTGLSIMIGMAGLTIAPWLLRNLLDSGQILPGGGTKTLFWREYNDFFTYVKPLDLPYYLNLTYPSPGWGVGPILTSKLSALLENLWLWGRGALFLSPLFVIGLWARSDRGRLRNWQRAEFLPFVVYSVLLYLAMSLAFTFPSTRGSTFHSSGGLLPFIFLASILGLDRAVDWLSRRYRPKAAARRQRSYGLLILVAYVLISVFSALNLSRNWNDDYDQVRSVGLWMDSQGLGNTLMMVPDATAFWYVNHKPSLLLTSDELPVDLELAHRYGIRYLMLQPLHLPDALSSVLDNKGAPGLKLVARLGEIQIYEIVNP